MGGPRFLHEELVVEEIDRVGAHGLGRDPRGGRLERRRPEIAIPLPHEHVAEEAARAAALGEVGGVRPGVGEIALHRAAQALDPRGVERRPPAHHAELGEVAAGVGVHRSGPYAGDSTWMTRPASSSFTLPA